jgi:hypothetical protein
MRTRLCVLFSAVLIAGALPASAVASGGGAAGGAAAGTAGESIYTQVLNAYQARGALNPCEFTSSQLEAALKALGTAGGQYFGDFVQAIQSALATRASSGCATKRPTAPARTQAPPSAAVPPAGGPGSGLPLHVGPVTAATGAGVPAPLLVLAVLVLALALLATAVVVVRQSGWDSAWAAACRHTVSEAGYRIGGLWDELADWLRT